MRIAYADPPYPGCAHLYRDHPDYAGEVDHAELAVHLLDYDGWILHTSSPALYDVETHLRNAGHRGYRVMPWTKTFAAFKRNVSVAYAWEPIIVLPVRKPVVKPGMTYRDWIAGPITLKRGLTGAKPEKICRYAFEVAGLEPDDELHDLFPGTGAVTRAWDAWRSQATIYAATSGGSV